MTDLAPPTQSNLQALIDFIDNRVEQRMSEVIGQTLVNIDQWGANVNQLLAQLQNNDKVNDQNMLALTRAVGELQNIIRGNMGGQGGSRTPSTKD